MAFPSNPSNNDTHSVDGVTYIYDSTVGVWEVETAQNSDASTLGGVAKTGFFQLDGNNTQTPSSLINWSSDPGTTKGSFHIGAASGTGSAGPAITFGARDSSSGGTAQAGIYIHSDGGYGTKMSLATTNSYASGAKRAMHIDHLGRVVTPRQPHIFGSPTNTGGAGIANSFSSLLSQGGLSFSNSRITVPVAGLYLVTFNTICDSATGREDTGIVINGSNRVNGLNDTNTSGYHYRSHSAVFKLSANDYIQFRNDDWYSAGNTGFVDWRTASVTLIG